MAVGIVIGLTLAAILMLIWLWENSTYVRTLKKIPGPPRLPIIGNLHLFKKERHEQFQQLLDYCNEYGNPNGIMCLWFGPNPVLILSRAKTIEPLLSGSKHITKSKEYDFLKPWLGTGLLTSTGSKWKTRRRLLTPTFHFKILQDFLQVFNEQSRILIKRLDEKAGQKEPFDIYPYFTLCTLDIICDSAMGKHTSAQTDTNSEYATTVQDMGHLLQVRSTSPWYYPDFIFNNTPLGKKHQKCLDVLHGFTQKVIRERSAELDEQLENETGKIKMEDLQTDKPFLIGKQKRLAFLDMLLIAAKGGADLSFSDIQEEVDTFMFEGHDTTAGATNWTVYLLGQHPDIQKRAQKEVDDLFGDSDRDITMEDLKNLIYLDCILKESLRVLPAVPVYARIIEEDCVIGGYTIPKGVSTDIVVPSLHKDPEHFPDPEKFDPDRWLPENSEGRHPYCYVPFSAGFRNCIGQKFAQNEAKSILARVLHNFTIKSHQTLEETKAAGELILRPVDGIKVTLSRRR